MADLLTLLRHSARYSPLYARKLSGLDLVGVRDAASLAQAVPLTQLDELTAEKQRTGDPFAGRRSQIRRPAVSFQVEGDVASSLYLALDARDLQAYANVLRGCWSLLGLGQGDHVAIFDYGGSPAEYLASSLYIPYLKVGAGDSLGCITIGNDGLPEMAGRAMDILRFVHPKAMFIRSDCVHPFLEETRRLELPVKRFLQVLVVEANEQVYPESVCQEAEARLGIPVFRMLRVDQAMFLAQECPDCRSFHFPSGAYTVEVVDEYQHRPLPVGQRGKLVITNLFARTTPAVRYLSDVRVALEPGQCSRCPGDGRLRA